MGDQDALVKVEAEVKAVSEQLREVEAEIKAVSEQLNEVEAEIKASRAAQDEKEVAALRAKEAALRTEKQQLRTKEDKLRAEKLLLLERQPVRQAGSSRAGSKGGSSLKASSALALALGSSTARLCIASNLIATTMAGPFYPLESLLARQVAAMASAAEAAGVLRCMRLNFPAHTQLAEEHGNEQLALDVFERAKAMPGTATSKQMVADGYHTVGPLFPHSNILFAHKGLVPKLVKPLRPKEAHRIRAFLAARGDVLNAHVVPFELLWENPAKGKSFMVMPKLPTCLDQVAPLSEAHACLFWEHMLSALEYLHALGFAHGDCKPSNICLQHEPCVFVLTDLGSIATFGERTSTTAAYVPYDMPRHVLRECSSAALDWCMLGMTMGEKCCGKAAITVHTGSQRMTYNNLMAHLRAHLLGTLWEAYSLKSGICEGEGRT